MYNVDTVIRSNTVSTVTGLTAYHVSYGFETVDMTDYSVQLEDNLVSSPVGFSEQL